MSSVHKQFRLYYRLVLAIIFKYWIAIIVGIAAGVVFFMSVPEFLKLLPRLKTSNHIAYIGKFSVTDIPTDIQKQISFGLTVQSSNGLPVPGLAKSWTVSGNGLEYVFELDERYTWQNGKPIRAAEISLNFKDVKIEYPSDKHIKFTLSQPFAPFLSVLTKPVFKAGSNPPLGVGTYKISSIKKNGQLIQVLHLTASSQSSVAIPDLSYHVYLSSSQAKTAFKLGLVSSVTDLSDVGNLNNWPGVSVHETIKHDQYLVVAFDTNKLSKNTRLGLAYATDKTNWQDNRALGPISPSSWAYNPELKTYDQDLNRARDLIKKDGKIPDKLTITTLPSFLSLSEQIATSWRKLNIEVVVQVVPIVPDDFEILVAALPTGDDPDQYNLWHSTQTQSNITHLKNPRIDKLLEEGRIELKIDKRKAIYQEFQKYLVEDVPVVFLYYPKSLSLSR